MSNAAAQTSRTPAYQQGVSGREKHGNLASCPYAEGSPEQDEWYDGWLHGHRTFPAMQKKHGAFLAKVSNPHDEDSEAGARYEYEAADFIDDKD